MVNNFSNKNIDKIFEDLKSGVKKVFENNEKYIRFLKTTSMWHKYSGNNKLNIWLQCLLRGYDGKYLNTFNVWKELGYSIKKGEKAMELLMPRFQKYFKDENNKWISTKNASEEQLKQFKDDKFQVKDVISSFFFKKALFDIRQTTCPEEEYEKNIRDNLIPKSLEESHDEKIDFLFLALKRFITDKEMIEVKIKKLEEESLKGYVTEDGIVLNEDNSNLQNLKTLIHEYTHYKLHIERENLLKRYQKELEAESVAYMVCSSYDIDTSEYSFRYITMYAEEQTEEELYKSYENITFTANSIKEALDLALSVEMLNHLGAGDIVYANINNQPSENNGLFYIIDNLENKYAAFNISRGTASSVTDVGINKDINNKLPEDSNVRMDVRYLIEKKDIVKKVGTVAHEDLMSISKHASLFENRNLIKDFATNKININNNISLDNSLDLSLKMKR